MALLADESNVTSWYKHTIHFVFLRESKVVIFRIQKKKKEKKNLNEKAEES